MKALILIDVPDGFETETAIAIVDVKNEKGEGGVGLCYPKPLPQMKSIELACQKEDEGNDYGAGLIVGWNDCLREITGETE